MDKGNVKGALQKLRMESVYDIIEGLDEIEHRIKDLRGKNLNETILALFRLLDVDVFDRPDLQPVVDRAFKILVALGGRAIPLILYELQAADLNVQLHLSRALGQIGKPAVKPLLKFYSGSFDPHRRIFALYAMAKIRDPEASKAIPRVIDAMDDSNAEVRDTATRALGKLAEHLDPQDISQKMQRKMFSALMKDLSDGHAGVRAKAVRSIGKMARSGFIGSREKSAAKKAMSRILGMDETFDWDRAYVVRTEAEETMKYLR